MTSQRHTIEWLIDSFGQAAFTFAIDKTGNSTSHWDVRKYDVNFKWIQQGKLLECSLVTRYTVETTKLSCRPEYSPPPPLHDFTSCCYRRLHNTRLHTGVNNKTTTGAAYRQHLSKTGNELRQKWCSETSEQCFLLHRRVRTWVKNWVGKLWWAHIQESSQVFQISPVQCVDSSETKAFCTMCSQLSLIDVQQCPFHFNMHSIHD